MMIMIRSSRSSPLGAGNMEKVSQAFETSPIYPVHQRGREAILLQEEPLAVGIIMADEGCPGKESACSPSCANIPEA